METPLDLDTLDDSSSVLAAVRRRREDEQRAAADVLALAVKYAAMHSVDSIAQSARLDAAGFGDRELSLAGEGAPLVAESAAVELAAVLGLSTQSGKKLLGEALELRYRLKHVWARVLDGTLPAWKARRIAERTIPLSADAARWVDGQVGPDAHKIGVGRLDRLVTDAIALFEPEVAAALAEQQTDERCVEIDTQPMLLVEPESGACATATVHAVLDVADALDLDTALSAITDGLREDEAMRHLSRDQLRAASLGALARGYNAGGLPSVPGTPRQLTLHVHADTADLAETGLVRLANTRGLATLEQLRAWAEVPGTVVRPVVVVDLNDSISATGYRPTAAQRQQAILINPTCVFPHCNQPAERCDLDHREPYDKGGGTTTANLAPVCRGHHWAKTHYGWTYERLGPGHYLWRSPQGFTYRTTPSGTADVTGDTRVNA